MLECLQNHYMHVYNTNSFEPGLRIKGFLRTLRLQDSGWERILIRIKYLQNLCFESYPLLHPSSDIISCPISSNPCWKSSIEFQGNFICDPLQWEGMQTVLTPPTHIYNKGRLTNSTFNWSDPVLLCENDLPA